jgi:spore coat polysaccharide biosynthesis protein SpsF
MKTIIVLIARLGSTRLKRKHLLEACGRPVLQWSIDRIDHEFRNEIRRKEADIIIATSDEKDNREFENLKNGTVFYGSIDNIPLRLLQCAESYDAENIISVDGDDILCSLRAMRKIYSALKEGKPYVKTTGLPLGLNAAGYKRAFISTCLEAHKNEKLETGWGRVFDETLITDIRMTGIKDDPDLRFTLDYDCDFDFFKKIICDLGEKLYSMDDRKLVDHVRKNGIQLLNRKVAQEYWDNFRKAMSKEKNGG